MANIADDTSNDNERRSFKDRKWRHSRINVALQKEAAEIGRKRYYAITVNRRDDNETLEESLQWLVDAHGAHPFLYAGVDVPASKPGAVHRRRAHAHLTSPLPQDLLRPIWAAKDARNAALPPSDPDDGLSCVIKPIKDDENRLRWLRYCESWDNLRHSGAVPVADATTAKRAALDLMHLEPRTQGKVRVSGQSLARARGRAYSPPKSDTIQTPAKGRAATPKRERNDPSPRADHHRAGGTVPNALQQEAGRAVIVTTSDAFDPVTGEIYDTAISEPTSTATLVIGRDLLGETAIPEAPVAAYHGGTMPEEIRAAVRLKLRNLGWTQDDLADLIGRSRCHLTNALEGRFGLDQEAADRLTAFLRDPVPPTPKRRAPAPRKARQHGNTAAPLFDLLAAA